jgi:hypothetical protein
MELTFPYEQLRDLLANAETRWPEGLRERYDEKDDPGFWLVGDQGVYLMHNGLLIEGQKPPIVFARECNPETMPFDEWWDAKNASFGGDDGVEFIDADVVRKAVADKSPLLVTLSPNEMRIATLAPKA